jgi:cbb3-type cytochrome oxidase subunit 1
MPTVTRLFLKTALLFFILALLSGVAVMARPLLNLPRFFAGLTPVYFHLFMVGWITQLIIGIAYWMFPRYSREQPRGSDRLIWATYGLLNLGLLLRVIAEPAQIATPAPAWGWLLAFSALLQWLAGMAFIANTWPRVRGTIADKV